MRIKPNKLSLPNKDNYTKTNVGISQYLVLTQEIRESKNISLLAKFTAL
jgi:hypothetical protein